MTLKLLLGYPIAKSLARSLESCEGGRVEHGSVFGRNISYFMPNKNLAWCDGQGDPTKSSLTSNLIDDVKRFEARGEGKCGRIFF